MIPGLEHIGTWWLRDDGDTIADRVTNSYGTITLDDDGYLWCVGRNKTWREFLVPRVLTPDLLRWNSTKQRYDLDTYSKPPTGWVSGWTDITRSRLWVEMDANGTVIDDGAVINPGTYPHGSRLEILGALLLPSDRWLYLIRGYYNTLGTHDHCVGLDRAGFWKLSVHSQKSAGYIGLVPEKYRDELGVYYSGVTVLQGRGQASHGPAIACWDFDEDSPPDIAETIPCKTVVMHGGTLDTEAGVVVVDENGANMHQTEGVAWTDEYLYCFGVRGTGAHWYGDGVETHDGVTYTDAVGKTYKGYHAESRQAMCWVYRTADLLRAARGEISPLVVPLHAEIVLNDWLGLSRGMWCKGAAYDALSGLVHVCVMGAKIANTSEASPVIFTFRVTQENEVMAAIDELRAEVAAAGVQVERVRVAVDALTVEPPASAAEVREQTAAVRLMMEAMKAAADKLTGSTP